MNIKAIPTDYNGTHFRSRLEARWAAMFDLIGWKWDYEPIDLSGYIPDFTLRFHKPLLIEVKPIIDVNDSKSFDDARAKLSKSGWLGEAVIVGSCMSESTELDGHTVIGRFADGHGAALLSCQCGYGLFDDLLSYHCRSCGSHSHGGYPNAPGRGAIEVLWREAGNRVQWRGRGNGSKRKPKPRPRTLAVYRTVPDRVECVDPVPREEIVSFFHTFELEE